MQPLKLVAVSAGLSRPSSTRLLAGRLADATVRHMDDDEAAAPVEVHVVELRDLATDIAENMVTGFPSAALRDALEAVTRADGVIAVTPVFTASYSGLFKSFFDVLDDTALTGKPVLIAATGGTARHSLALEHAMRPLFAYLRALVAPTGVFAASEDWGAGDARTDDLTSRIRRAAGEFGELLRNRPCAVATPGERPGGTAEADAMDEVVPFAQQLAALRPR